MQHQLVGVALAKSYVFLYYVSTACSLEQRTTEYRQRQIVAQGLTKTKTKTCFLFLHFVVLFCFDKNNNKIKFAGYCNNTKSKWLKNINQPHQDEDTVSLF